MASELIAALESLEQEARTAIAAASNTAELEAVRIHLLGRKEGRLTALVRGLGNVEPADRPAVGATANRVKQIISTLLDERVAELTAPAATAQGVDLTLPGRSAWRGARHPVTVVVDEICAIFRALGFTRVRGPEAETDWYNFEALNTPLDHPAADAHDTFYLAPGLLLRSHTSPVQIRTMQAYQPPIRVVVPGMVYRRDPFDASHAPAFEQIEGLAVDEGVSFVDLKATLAEFAHRFFGPEAEVRFRPSFFPFTEPSAEVDVSCLICSGRGCSVCKGSGWLEIMGAGMVHPRVFENAGYDSERYTGFAFGMGPARIAMLRYRIPDIRLLYESDVRFLEQFA
ncbi:MAG TPA: phenylalanine--tRNA ligase subunit alpha [Longimicrobiales bacterium]|nr:phenylalanine--tRNA ligase subunit alpha [Longimicrobiales bacterium]